MSTAVASPSSLHRVLALALLLLVVALIYGLVVEGLIGRYHYYQNSVMQHQEQLAQLERVAATQEALQQRIAAVQRDPGIAAQYLAQSNPALAAAELQQRLKTVVDATGATLQSTQALPPVDEGAAIKVTVSALFSGDTGSLQQVLYALESQTPLLFVDNLEVSGRITRPRLPSGRYANYTRIQLSAQFEVSGYLRKEGG